MVATIAVLVCIITGCVICILLETMWTEKILRKLTQKVYDIEKIVKDRDG